jgi:hypothetical protein
LKFALPSPTSSVTGENSNSIEKNRGEFALRYHDAVEAEKRQAMAWHCSLETLKRRQTQASIHLAQGCLKFLLALTISLWIVIVSAQFRWKGSGPGCSAIVGLGKELPESSLAGEVLEQGDRIDGGLELEICTFLILPVRSTT